MGVQNSKDLAKTDGVLEWAEGQDLGAGQAQCVFLEGQKARRLSIGFYFWRTTNFLCNFSAWALKHWPAANGQNRDYAD